MLELIGIDGLTQWDVGRQVKVDKDINMVHFSNRPYGYSKNVKVTDGVADVPDMFLTSCAPLHIWAYIGNFEKGYTKIEKIYEVKPKNRPEDYIYTPEEVKTWEKLQSEIGDLANLETEAKENIVAAVNEAAKSGGAENAVLYTQQNLTNAQREQARANINAVGNEAIEFFNSEFKTHSEICKAYESGKVCYYPYAGTKLMNNGYSGRRQPFVFSGINGNNEFLTVTVNTDNSVVYGDIGIYNLTEVPQATAEAIGGVKADSAEAVDTQPVRIGGDGKLYTAPGGTDTTLTQSGKAADAKAVGDALAEKADIPDIPATLPNPNALTFTGAVNATYDGSTAVSVEIPSGGSGGTDVSLGLTSAAVGQIIKVKAIDESGKPTAWEALDRAWKVAETYLLKDMTFPAAISIPQGKDSLLMLSGTDITPDKNTNVNITMGTAQNQSGYSSRWGFTQKMYAHGWGCGMFLELNYIRDGTAHFWMRQTGWEKDSHRNQIFEDKPTGETNRFFYILSVDNAENINKNTTANIILYTRDAL